MISGEPSLIAVLTVGDEILSGEITDSNFLHIASALSQLGLRISYHATVGDSQEHIVYAIKELSRRTDALIVTGGLGPTDDDRTAAAVAVATECELELHQDIVETIRRFFERLNRSMNRENIKQAYIPRGATVIPPAGGTAPGFMLEYGNTLLSVLPGVPIEMEAMLLSHVIPQLRKRFSAREVVVTRRIMTFGAGESDVAGMVSNLIEKSQVDYGFLVMGGPVVVKLTARALSAADAKSLLDEEQARVESCLGKLVYGIDDEPMEEVVGRLLRTSGLTLALAESCTGGMVSSRITNVPGCSDYFMGGVVSYITGAKSDVLGISESQLSEGTVSKGVAESMALAARRLFGADLGLGITGVAGPDTGGERKPVGTVCVGLSHDKGVGSWEVRLPGDRKLIRSIAAYGALNAVRLYLIDNNSVY